MTEQNGKIEPNNKGFWVVKDGQTHLHDPFSDKKGAEPAKAKTPQSSGLHVGEDLLGTLTVAALGAGAEKIGDIIEDAAEAFKNKTASEGDNSKKDETAPGSIGSGSGEGGNGKPPSGPETPKSDEGGERFNNLTFTEIQDKLNDPKTSDNDKRDLQTLKDEAVKYVAELEGGEYLERVRQRIEDEIEISTWNEPKTAIALRLEELATTTDNNLSDRAGSKQSRRGLMKIAIGSEAKRLIILGIEKKETEDRMAGHATPDEWYANHKLTAERIANLRKEVERTHIYNLLPINAESMVGILLEKPEEPTVNVRPTLADEEKPLFREQPLHLGGVFKGGRNRFYVEDRQLIPTLDLQDRNDRLAFVYRNLYTYNKLFVPGQGMSSSWLAVIKNWETDADFANLKGPISEGEMSEFKRTLRASMAITASARAMEASGGSWTSYAVALTGGERGNMDWQDSNVNFLLHADPNKLNEIINSSSVNPYYQELMRDAGLISNPYHEWREFSDPDSSDPDKVIQTPSIVELAAPSKDIRESSQLVKYLEKSARLGGFDGYIKDVLLAGEDPAAPDYAIKFAAAKLACDAFLVDKYTRWEYLVIDQGKESKDIQPIDSWGGDPLKSALKPTFLPRLKKVFSGAGSDVLDIIDSAFRPQDLYDDFAARIYARYGATLSPSVRPVLPSAVTNIKTLNRYNNALDRTLGGPMASGLPAWSSKTMGEELPAIAELIDQVYGVQAQAVYPDKNDPTKKITLPVGKHIAGSVMMRLLHAKALAVTLESRAPTFADNLEVIVDPQSRTRPLGEIRAFLYGAKGTGAMGFIEKLTGGQYEWMIGKNIFDAQQEYTAVRNLIETNDQGGKSNENRLNTLGFIGDVSNAIGKVSGVIKK